MHGEEKCAKCHYHSGYFKITNKKTGDGKWTCCGEESMEAPTCVEDKHKFADWPEEDSKKYFYDKPLKNPSENWKD